MSKAILLTAFTGISKGNEMKGPAIVCIGGGTGLSALLRGLKKATKNITAIVTVSDDGGGSGILRDELGMPPPGDIRNCMQALSNAEPTIEKLMDYRFESGSLNGQSFGNLFLAAINGISDSFDKAVEKMGEVLSITGRILPVTIDDVHIRAYFEDDSMVVGESKIAAAKNERHSRIKRVELAPAEAIVLPECIKAIEEADLIILGPGSLYTSIIPNLLVKGIVDAILCSDALKLFICNVMTEPGETDGYTASEHIRELFNHSGGKLFEYSLVNSKSVPQDILDRYIEDGAAPVQEDEELLCDLGVEIIHAPIVEVSGNWVRHDSDKLTREILRVFYEKAPTRRYGE